MNNKIFIIVIYYLYQFIYFTFITNLCGSIKFNQISSPQLRNEIKSNSMKNHQFHFSSNSFENDIKIRIKNLILIKKLLNQNIFF